MPATYRIVATATRPSLETARLGRVDTWVTYDLVPADGKGPINRYTIRIPEDTPTPQAQEEAVRKDATVKAQIIGKTGSV